ncbi:MAG: VWA domain-containing protein, partial [Acidimicrobiales bacterium]
TPQDPDVRTEAIGRRMAFDADPVGFAQRWHRAEDELATRVRSATPVPLEAGRERAIAELCVAAGAEGLRADLVICRAASALGGWRAKELAGGDEVATVAPLALGHRRRTPFGSSALEQGDLDDLVSKAFGRDEAGGRPDVAPSRSDAPAAEVAPHHDGSGDAHPADGHPDQRVAEEPPPTPPAPAAQVEPAAVRGLLDPKRRGAQIRTGSRGSGSTSSAATGRTIGSEPLSGPGAIAPRATVVAAVVRTAGAAPLQIDADDLRSPRREHQGDNVVVLAVDTSGSMGVGERVAAARGAVLALVADAYQHRDRVAVVSYRDDGADVVLRPTSSTEVALARLAEVATGGRTPLAAGIDVARILAIEERRRGSHPLVVLVTDGRATWADGADPVQAAMESARACKAKRLDALVVDCEGSARPLGIARQLAEAMGARYVAMDPGLAGTEGGAGLARAIAESLR